MTAIFPCERCGNPQDTVEVTSYGDPGPVYLPTGCDCPRARCPFSHGPLDIEGRCSDVDCFMWFTVIPVPEMR